MIRCDDECPRGSLAGPLLGALATIAAAAVGPLLEARHRRRKQEREDDRRIARLEALMAVQMVDDEECDDGA
jgi:hypothetical protein